MKRFITILSATLFMALLISPMALAKSGSGPTFGGISSGGFSFGNGTFTRTRTRTSTASSTTTDTDTSSDTSTSLSTGRSLDSSVVREITTGSLKAIDTTASKQDQIAGIKARNVMRSLANSPVDDVKQVIRSISSDL